MRLEDFPCGGLLFLGHAATHGDRASTHSEHDPKTGMLWVDAIQSPRPCHGIEGERVSLTLHERGVNILGLSTHEVEKKKTTKHSNKRH